MRTLADIKTLRKIAAVRDLQRARAETAAQRAAITLQSAQLARDEKEHQLAALDQGWRDAVAGTALGTGIAAAWSTALVRQSVSLRESEAERVAAHTDHDRCINEWRFSVLQCDVSHQLADRAVRNAARRRDEARLNEAAERHPGRKSRA
jgi:hypothetical protein